MGVLWGMDIFNVFVFQSLGVLLPIWKDELGVTPFQAGLLGSAGFLGFGLMALPASIWLTRYNLRLVVLVCALGMAATAALQAAAPIVTLLILGRFAFVMLSVSRVQMQVLFIQQWFQPRLYATINSIDFGNRSLGQTLAVVLTPTLVIILGSWRTVYGGVTLGLVIFSVLWIILGRERVRPQTAIGGDNPPPIGNPAGVLKRHKALWLVAGAQIGAAVTFGAFITFWPTYAIDRMGISLTTAGILMGFLPIGSIIGSLSSGPLSQLIGRRKPFVWVPGIFLPVIFFVLVQATSQPVIAVLFLIAGYLQMTVPPIISTIPFDMKLAPRETAVALGLNRTLFPLFATLGPIIVGVIGETTGSLGTGLAIVSPLAVSLLIAGLLIPETGPKGPGYRVAAAATSKA